MHAFCIDDLKLGQTNFMFTGIEGSEFINAAQDPLFTHKMTLDADLHLLHLYESAVELVFI